MVSPVQFPLQNTQNFPDKIPRFLYKFRSLSRESIDFTKSIFEKRQLFFACPTKLNDPFEGYFAFPRESYSNFESPEKLEEFRIKIRDDFLSKVGILSLSARYDSSVMWSHYADSHSGLCLEFDLEVAIKKNWGPVLFPVTYSVDCLTAEFSKLSDVMTASLYHKSKDWIYEEEWRFINLKGSGAIQFPQEMLSGVIFGAQVDRDVGQQVYEILRSYPSKIEFGTAGRDPFSYNTRVMHSGDSVEGFHHHKDDVRPWRR